MFSDPKSYSQFHSMTFEAANIMLDRVLPEMEFDEEDVVMDVGCASGDNTKDVLLSRIPRLKKLIGIDISPRMIEFARMNMANPKIEYYVADIEDKTSLKEWEGSISKIFSIHCFQWVKDQKKAFELLHYLLQPKGEAALIFLLISPLWDCYPSIINDVKWNKYLKDADTRIPVSHHLKLRSENYRQLLEELGFEVIRCQDDSSSSFAREGEYRETYRMLSALPSYIPEELKEEFMDDLLREIDKFLPVGSDGLPAIKILLTLHIRKR